MADNKTQPTQDSVEDFLNQIEPQEKRTDSFELLQMMETITGEKPVLWGPSIIGFGTYHYRYETGREGDMPIVGFSPRKQNLTLYCMSDAPEFKNLLSKLGKHTTSVACLYIKRLSDVDKNILEKLIKISVKNSKNSC